MIETMKQPKNMGQKIRLMRKTMGITQKSLMEMVAPHEYQGNWSQMEKGEDENKANKYFNKIYNMFSAWRTLRIEQLKDEIEWLNSL